MNKHSNFSRKKIEFGPFDSSKEFHECLIWQGEYFLGGFAGNAGTLEMRNFSEEKRRHATKLTASRKSAKLKRAFSVIVWEISC